MWKASMVLKSVKYLYQLFKIMEFRSQLTKMLYVLVNSQHRPIYTAVNWFCWNMLSLSVILLHGGVRHSSEHDKTLYYVSKVVQTYFWKRMSPKNAWRWSLLLQESKCSSKDGYGAREWVTFSCCWQCLPLLKPITLNALWRCLIGWVSCNIGRKIIGIERNHFFN